MTSPANATSRRCHRYRIHQKCDIRFSAPPGPPPRPRRADSADASGRGSLPAKCPATFPAPARAARRHPPAAAAPKSPSGPPATAPAFVCSRNQPFVVTATNAVPVDTSDSFAIASPGSGSVSSISKYGRSASSMRGASNPASPNTTRCVGRITSPSESSLADVIMAAVSGYAGWDSPAAGRSHASPAPGSPRSFL